MINFNDLKNLTPNEFAKLVVADMGEGSDYWGESSFVDYDEFTTLEKARCCDAVDRQQARVREFLGIDKIEAKRSA